MAKGKDTEIKGDCHEMSKMSAIIERRWNDRIVKFPVNNGLSLKWQVDADMMMSK